MQNQNHHHLPLIASILTVLVGIGMFAQMWIGGAFAQATSTIEIQSPGLGYTWHWGQTGQWVSFSSTTDIQQVKITLSQGGAASNPSLINLILDDNCAVTDHSRTVCFFNIPSKPADAPDGDGYFVSVQKVDGSTVGPAFDMQPIRMESGVAQLPDFSFDTTQGVNGFVFNPLAAEVGQDTDVSVWVKYSNNSGESSPSTIMNVLVGFTNGSSFIERNYPVLGNELAGITANTSRLISLGTLHRYSQEFNFQLFIDPINQVEEGNEANNFYIGGMNSGHPPITLDDGSAITPLSGTYYSQKLAVPESTKRFNNWTDFTAVYNAPVNTAEIQTNTAFGLGFFKNGINLCVTYASECANDNRFDDGYFKIDTLSHYDDTNQTSTVSMSALDQITWLTGHFDAVQVRVEMSSSNHYGDADAQPWVQSVDLTYQADQLGIVGYVTGNTVVPVTRGQSAAYTFQINRTPESQFTGAVNWSVVPTSSGNQGVTFSPASGTVNFGNGASSDAINIPVQINADATAQSASFTILAEPQDSDKAMSPLDINVLVQGAAPYTLTISPVTSSVVQGDSITFHVSLFHAYTQDVSLADNIASIFGDDVTGVTYSRPDKKILAGTTGPVDIAITAANANTSAIAKSFTITGASSTDSSSVSATLSITDAGNVKNISLVLTAPIEGGQDTAQPIFTLRLYNAANAKVFEKTDIKTVANEATVAIPNLTVGGIYRGFIRSTRHLWQQGLTTITVGTADSYTMSFNKLLAGDIDPNNVVNALDVPVLTHDWGKTGVGLLPDFNSDGSINALDIVSIISNWFKVGATLPGN